MAKAIIDAHLHVWDMPSERFPWRPLRNMRPAQPAPVEQLLDIMAHNGVDKAVIVQPSNYGYDHSYILDCMARYPDRFGAVALLDVHAGDAVDRLRALAQQGIWGVRFYLYHEPDLAWLQSAATANLVDEAGALGVSITVFGRWDMLDGVAVLARDHQRTAFVLDHLGHPDVADAATWPAVLRLAELPNVHIKVSDFVTLSRRPFPFDDLFPFVRQVHAAFGAGRMMWASNFPHVLRGPGYAPSLTLVDAALPELSAYERAMIMGGTAARLWML